MVQTNTDGSCWLSVLIVSMSCTPELAQLVDGLTTRAARDRLVDESTKNWDRHYKDFFMNEVRDTYLADMTLHGTYGDHAALAAFATTFHVKIRVWGATEDVDHVVVPNGAQGEVEVNIGHRRTDSDSDSDHYFAVLMGIVPPIPIGLDGEWEVDGTTRFDLLQLAYRLKPDDEIDVILIPMHMHSTMPGSLLDWLNSPRYECLLR